MKKFLMVLTVTALVAFLATAAWGQAAIANKNVDRDLNAFAQGSLTPAGGGFGSLSISLDVDPPTATTSISAFAFGGSEQLFAFGTQALAPGEFDFPGSLDSAHVHAVIANSFSFNANPNSFAHGDVLVDLTWTAVSRTVKQEQVNHIVDPNNNAVFHFSQNSRTRTATISGSLTGTVTGATATCCTFASAHESANARQNISVIHP